MCQRQRFRKSLTCVNGDAHAVNESWGHSLRLCIHHHWHKTLMWKVLVTCEQDSTEFRECRFSVTNNSLKWVERNNLRNRIANDLNALWISLFYKWYYCRHFSKTSTKQFFGDGVSVFGVRRHNIILIQVCYKVVPVISLQFANLKYTF